MSVFTVRKAILEDIPVIADLIVRSTQTLQSRYYTSKQLEGALGSAFGVDSQLIMDGTYFVAEMGTRIAGSGGWSKRKTLFGADSLHKKDDTLLDPVMEPARIRAFFVESAYARRGIGSLLMKTCEAEALSYGFSQLELAATLAGVPLYVKHGFTKIEDFTFPLPNGEMLSMVRMQKQLVAHND